MSEELWYPGRPPRGAVRMFVPDGYATGPAWVCRVPRPDGSLCGARFGREVSLMRHVRDCAARNEDAIRSSSLEQRVSVMESWDPEVGAHMRGVGRRMLSEGRWMVRPSERAGFS